MIRNLMMIALALSVPMLALAQEPWPSRPVTLMVGAPPGGSMDTLARLLSIPLGQALDKPVVVVNRPGGGQLVATTSASGPNDGHTFLIATEGLALNVNLHRNAPDPRKSLQPLMLMTRSSLAIVAAPGSPYKSLPELVAAARATPDGISYGSAGGTATLSNLVMVGLQSAANVRLLHVPYTGGAQAVQATMAGQTQLTAGTSFLVRPQVEGGRLQPIAVTSETREPSLPQVPTLAELGHPSLTTYAWWGFFVPRDLPPAVQARLHAELRKIFASAFMRERLTPQGMDIVASTPGEFSQMLDTEIAKWGKLIVERDIKAGQ